MLEALNLSGAYDKVKDKDVTILAPTNDAFQDLWTDGLAELLQEPSRISDLIARHILDRVYTHDELSARTEVVTVSGETLPVIFEGGVLRVDGGVVTEMGGGELNGGEGDGRPLLDR